MSLRRQLARRTRAIAIIAVTVVAGIASAIYLLVNERLESPFATSYTVNAPFVNVSGIAAGLGVPVSVAGVRVGEVTSSSLREGAAVLRLQIDPHLLPRVGRRRAAASAGHREGSGAYGSRGANHLEPPRPTSACQSRYS